MMKHNQIDKIVIVGGGTAGWIAAGVLTKFMGHNAQITLIESDAIGTVGVGEATIPQILRLNGMLGLDEREFMAATKATFKLGIEFNNWGHKGESYLHTFGQTGINLSHLDFHHYWLRSVLGGKNSSLWDYSLHHKAAYADKFGHMDRVGNTQMTGLSYAYHFDAGLYAGYLRRICEGSGVIRKEGKVTDTTLDPESGFITSVTMDDGSEVEGQLFIDCSGFRGLLIGQALGVGYQDWSKWLPANRAVAVGCEKVGPAIPYTKATAHDAGWQWRIPLQHRTGNGHVYSDGFTDQDTATQILLDNLDAPATTDPKHLRFTTGRREKFWHKNCVSLGLASGFLEPLESTSIHLIQTNVSKLIELFPTQGFSERNIQEYNQQITKEYELIRDFLILHYHRTDREDTEFWRYCKNLDVPDTLSHKLNLFKDTGISYKEPQDLFGDSSWTQVMVGQGLMPNAYHAMADRLSDAQLDEFLRNVQTIIDRAVTPLKSHEDYVQTYCGAAA